MDIFEELNKRDEQIFKIKQGVTKETASASKQVKQIKVNLFIITQNITITIKKGK